MCDSLSSSIISFSLSKFTKPQTLTPNPKFPPPNRLKLPANAAADCALFPSLRRGESDAGKSSCFTPCSLGSGNNGFPLELGFKEEDDEGRGGEDRKSDGGGRRSGGEEVAPEFLEPKEGKPGFQEEDLVRFEDGNGGEEESLVTDNGITGTRKRKQDMRRSGLLAKQVISIRSALSLGFITQLWVDTTSWVVLFVEVRPNLLSGECERFLLEDISQVGDVVLVEDESVIENEFKMIGLETLVGYKVVTPGRWSIGKVRGFTFNINSGVIESLELDSFGISIIPSSLVSTYALLVEDILEVLSDAVVVHEAAASRIQRLTKGLLDSQNVGTNIDDLEELSGYETPSRYEQSNSSSRTRKFRKRNREIEDDWELPMDYL